MERYVLRRDLLSDTLRWNPKFFGNVTSNLIIVLCVDNYYLFDIGPRSILSILVISHLPLYCTAERNHQQANLQCSALRDCN